MRYLFLAFLGVTALLGMRSDMIFEPLEQRFLFRPRSANLLALIELASRDDRIEEVSLKTHDGITLHGWLKHPSATAADHRFPLVIVFGGVRLETSWMIDRANKPERWGWLFINYRGFGLSQGTPSGREISQDAHLIFDYAATRPDVDPSRIVVMGRSLGTYFTVVLAQSRRVRGAILATPFDSFAALGKERYPWLPVEILLNGRYDAASLAPRIKVPGLFILAERDNVTPIENGTALAQLWGGPRRVLTLSGARHYGIERRDDFWRHIANFLRDLEKAGAGEQLSLAQDLSGRSH